MSKDVTGFINLKAKKMIAEKRCTRCGEIKSFSEFYKRKGVKDGLESECRKCKNDRTKKRYKENPEIFKARNKKWALKNPDREKTRHQKWAKLNPEKRKEIVKKSRAKHPETHKRILQRWQSRNREKLNEMARRWAAANPDNAKLTSKRKYEKKMSTPQGRLNQNVRSLINYSLRGAKGGIHWEDLVGYTLDELKKHIEKQFSDNMTWENYGKYGWHIDHKIPLAAFNFKTPMDIDFKKAWALSNLQPLWAEDNLKKSTKLERPFQPSLALAVNY